MDGAPNAEASVNAVVEGGGEGGSA